MADVAAAATPTTGGASPETNSTAQTNSSQQDPQAQGATPGEGAQQQAPVAEPRFYERKINGKAEKIPADDIDKAAKALGLDPQELLRGTQLAKASYERFEAARKLQDQFNGLKGKDPWTIAKEMQGLDDAALDRLAEQRLIAKLQNEARLSQLTPEQQQYERQRLEFERQRAEFAEQQRAAQEQALSVQATEMRSQMEPMIISEMEKAGLPKTPAAVRAVVDQLQTQHRHGLPLDFAEAVRSAQDQFINPTAEVLGKMPPEQLVKLLGKEAVDAILRHSIAQKPTPESRPIQPPTAPAQEKPRTWMTTKEWNDQYLK
ncbi:MAG TPA: hypothetical protein VFP50_18230 [Anaeromyxobacteraceae bacterium]|nr:hypothetical protein [Anaeromyxobacteraceae bacterium]